MLLVFWKSISFHRVRKFLATIELNCMSKGLILISAPSSTPRILSCSVLGLPHPSPKPMPTRLVPLWWPRMVQGIFCSPEYCSLWGSGTTLSFLWKQGQLFHLHQVLIIRVMVIGDSSSMLTILGLAHPHLCQQDCLYCAVPERCRASSPKCCSLWGQEQLSYLHYLRVNSPTCLRHW